MKYLINPTTYIQDLNEENHKTLMKEIFYSSKRCMNRKILMYLKSKFLKQLQSDPSVIYQSRELENERKWVLGYIGNNLIKIVTIRKCGQNAKSKQDNLEMIQSTFLLPLKTTCINFLHFSTRTLGYGEGNILASMYFKAIPADKTNFLKCSLAKYGRYMRDYVAKSPEFGTLCQLVAVKSWVSYLPLWISN